MKSLQQFTQEVEKDFIEFFPSNYEEEINKEFIEYYIKEIDRGEEIKEEHMPFFNSTQWYYLYRKFNNQLIKQNNIKLNELILNKINEGRK